MDKKKVYEVLFNGPAYGLNEYMQGRISGAICALTGSNYPWLVAEDGKDCTIRFCVYVDSIYMKVMDWINTYYPTYFVGVREIE